MIETDDVDDDYFTPVSSTSLANIFGSTSQVDKAQNQSLKYVPPKPQILAPKPEESKATNCLFACAITGYEWYNNTYTAKGKLGFAIVIGLKTGLHNIVLYDPNKTTLSCTLISPKLEVTVNKNSFISYYDNAQKYWSLNTIEDEANKIVEILKSLNVSIKSSSDIDYGPPEFINTQDISNVISLEQQDKDQKENDTDSSINRKTKMSILNRMATMGQSVLPPHKFGEKTSDSSDTNDKNTQPKVVRHKASKSVMKRNSSEKNPLESQSFVDTHIKTIIPKNCSEKNSLYTFVNGQLVPVTNTNLITSTSSNSSDDLNCFISEQRISNSELRINLNRVTDKVDLIINKVNDLENKDRSNITTTIHTDILQKLLAEYENKISIYEDLLKNTYGLDIRAPSTVRNTQIFEIDTIKNKIVEIEQINIEKQQQISILYDEIRDLKKEHCDEICNYIRKEHKMLNNISKLNDDLNNKNAELIKIKEVLENSPVTENDVENKVKNIMNDTFQAILINFNEEENYTGNTIKSIIAKVIKKVTIEALSQL